jgi:hypothetical protein
VIAVDTSVVVAGFASWHELHGVATKVLERRPRLPGQCALETYSVLTRLPPPHRASPDIVRDFLTETFGEPYLAIDARRYPTLIETLVAKGITGGATYDALVATVALEAGATLLTCDRRAQSTYERLGTRIEFVD